MYVLVAVLAVIVVAVAIWVANSGGNEESTTPTQENPLADENTAPDRFVKIEGGTFQMGDIMGDKEYDNETLHPVTVGTFYLSPYEVTFEEYDRYCEATGKEKPTRPGLGPRQATSDQCKLVRRSGVLQLAQPTGKFEAGIYH